MAMNRGGVQFPGSLNLAGNSAGSFPGAAVSFIAGEGEALATNMAAFFEDKGLVTYIKEVVVPGGILVYWTKHLDQEELGFFDEVNMEVEQRMRVWREEKAKLKNAEQEKAEAFKKEQERLAVLGKRCEENHGAVLKERKLKAVKK